MLKNKQKTFAVIFLIIALISTVCFATSEEVAPISADAEQAVTTTSQDDANDQIVEETTEDEPVDTSAETAEPQLIESDLYLAGETLTVSDYIDGNVYAIAGDITVSGKIGGDLFILANNVNLTQDSYTYGNLYVCANQVTIDGIVCDLYACCSNLSIGESGIVLRDSRTSSANFSLAGNIGRNAFAQANSISMQDSAHIYGNFDYTAKEAIVVPSGSVDGSINYSELNTKTNSADVKDIIIAYVMDFVYALVYTLVVFGLILLVAPKFTDKLHELTKTKWLASFGIGLLVLILVPVIAVLLVFTYIGTPLSFAIAALYLLVLSITFAITAISLSKLLANKVPALAKFHNIFALIIVTLVLWALTQIPFYVGTVVKLLITIFGLGIFILSIFKKEHKE